MTTTRTLPDVLCRAREVVEPAARAAIGRLSPEIRPLVEYHLGYRDERGRACDGSAGGKGVRPALALLSAESAGAPAATGVPGAVAVELVHNFSLLHDDVIDCDTERRHRPTVWSLHGIGRAIIAGDALLALSQRLLLETPGGRGAAAALTLSEATGAMIDGQALDMAFESCTAVDLESCLVMEQAKTGALLGCASSIGAVLAGAPQPVRAALEDFGVQLGLAFQAVDDLLGIWGDPRSTGKPVYSDLRQHKKTLPVVVALAAGDGAASELGELLAREHLDEAGVTRAAGLVETCGGREITAGEARRCLAAALAALERAPLAHRARAELAEVADFVVAREH
ncbi:MAG: polyprenyl synthetase family protein [Acidimicrobiales bacterium]